MKKVFLVLAAAIVAVCFVLGLQWYEQYKIASFITEKGPAATKQTMQRFGTTFGPAAGLEFGDVSAGLDSVTIQSPVLVCDSGKVRRIIADKAVVSAVEVDDDFGAIARMNLDLFGAVIFDGQGRQTLMARQVHIKDLRLEDNDPYPDLLAHAITYSGMIRNLDDATLEADSGTVGAIRLAQAAYLQVAEAEAAGLRIRQVIAGKETNVTMAKVSLKNMRQPLAGIDPPYTDLAKIKQMLSESLIDDITIQNMHMEMPGNESLRQADVAKVVAAAKYADETVRYQFDCYGITFELSNPREAKAYKDFLAELGYQRPVDYNLSLKASLGFADNTMSLQDISLWSEGLGKLSMTLGLSDLDYEKLFSKHNQEQAVERSSLAGFTLRYTDQSLVGAAKRYIAKQSGTSVLAINAQLLAVTVAGKMAIEDPNERMLAVNMARFALNPGTISMEFKPNRPVPMAGIAVSPSGNSDFEQYIKNGEVKVTYTPPQRQAPEKK